MSATQLVKLTGTSVESLTSNTDSGVGLGVVGSGIHDNSVIKGRFTFNKCADVHVGNIVVHQNISVWDGRASVGDSGSCQFKEEFEKAARELQTKNSATRWFYNQKVLAGCTTLCILILCIIGFVALKINKSSQNDVNKHITPSENSRELEEEYPKKLKFVSRETWNAALTSEEFDKNTLPVQRVIFIHTVSAGTCNKFSSCKQQVLNIQDFHISIGLGDIGYNFVIGGDGFIYVGRGWDLIGAHTKGFNNNSLGVAFIGDFRTDELNESMISAVKTLLDYGVKESKISEDYQLFGHCQMLRGFPFSPGRNVMKHIKLWSHWNSTNFDQCKG